MGFGWNENRHNWNTNEKLKWGSNGDVFTAFANRDIQGKRAKNVAYFAEEGLVRSYDLTIGVWNWDKPIILEAKSSPVTNRHISNLYWATRSATGKIPKQVLLQDGGQWGKFPSKEYWSSVLNPNYKDYDFDTHLRNQERFGNIGNVCLHKRPGFQMIDLYDENGRAYEQEIPGYEFYSTLNMIQVFKVNNKWQFELFGDTYRVRKLKDFRRICSFFSKAFVADDTAIQTYLHEGNHEHCERVQGIVDDFKAYLERLQNPGRQVTLLAELTTEPLADGARGACVSGGFAIAQEDDKGNITKTAVKGLVIGDYGIHQHLLAKTYVITFLKDGYALTCDFNNKINAVIMAREIETFADGLDLVNRSLKQCFTKEELIQIRERIGELQTKSYPLEGYYKSGVKMGLRKA